MVLQLLSSSLSVLSSTIIVLILILILMSGVLSRLSSQYKTTHPTPTIDVSAARSKIGRAVLVDCEND
jgi:hypothetical protein